MDRSDSLEKPSSLVLPRRINMSKRGRELLDISHPLKTPRTTPKFSALRLTSPHTGVSSALCSLKDPTMKSRHCDPVVEVSSTKEAANDEKACRTAKKLSDFQRLVDEDMIETKLLLTTVAEYEEMIKKYKETEAELEEIRVRNRERSDRDEVEFRDLQTRLKLANEQLAGVSRKLEAVRDATNTLDEEHSVLCAKETAVQQHTSDLQADTLRLEEVSATLVSQESGIVEGIRVKLAANEKISLKIAADDEEVAFLRKEIAHFASLKKG